MAASFSVTPGSLTVLAGQLSGSVGDIGSVAETVSRGDAAAAGDPGLEHVVSGYLACWSTRLRDLSERLSELSAALAGAADSYLETDSSVGATFQ